MRSEDKLAVIMEPFDAYGGKMWVRVKLLQNDNCFIPSFEDLFRIITAICECEDLKYPGGRGRFMVRDFLKACCEERADWETIRRRYAIPSRG
jgi:hypothetical protein